MKHDEPPRKNWNIHCIIIAGQSYDLRLQPYIHLPCGVPYESGLALWLSEMDTTWNVLGRHVLEILA